MEWKIEHLQDAGIIKTIVTGIVSFNEIKVLTTEQLFLSKQLNVKRFLSIYENVYVNISIFDVYNMPKILQETGQTNHEKFAVVYSPDSQCSDKFTFFDTRCANTALNLKVFTDSNTAYQWLIDGSTI